jgi:hypothetical protein
MPCDKFVSMKLHTLTQLEAMPSLCKAWRKWGFSYLKIQTDTTRIWLTDGGQVEIELALPQKDGVPIWQIVHRYKPMTDDELFSVFIKPAVPIGRPKKGSARLRISN